MKYKRKRKTIFKTWHIFLLLLITILSVSISYAFFTKELKINGTAKGEWTEFDILYLNINTTSSDPITIHYKETYTNTFSTPPTISSITMGGTELIKDVDYTYSDGTLTIPNVTGTLLIIGEEETFTVTYICEGGYFPNNNSTTNIVTYTKNSRQIKSGEYVQPRYSEGSFRAWFTTSTFKDGTQFYIDEYTGDDITVYAQKGLERAAFNARSLMRRLHDGQGTYNGKTDRLKTIIVAIKEANEVPSWAVDKNWGNNLGNTDEYFWLLGNNGETFDGVKYTIPILIWYDKTNGTMYWYSEDKSPVVRYTEQYGIQIGLNYFNSVTDISGIENWDVSQLDQMEGFFAYCTSLTDLSPIRNWDVSNVTNMKKAFNTMTALQDASAINDWDITNVTDFTNMFDNTKPKPNFTKVEGSFDANGTFVPSN